MQTRVAIAVLTGASLLLAGCLPLRRTIEVRTGSLKDDAPASASAPAPNVRSTAVPAPAPIAQPAVIAPGRPRGTQDIAADEKAREAQLARCAQRHVDYQAGQLNESAEQKQVRDQICAELHRADHARKDGR